jgi:hypothetical protein
MSPTKAQRNLVTDKPTQLGDREELQYLCEAAWQSTIQPADRDTGKVDIYSAVDLALLAFFFISHFESN